MKIPESPPKIPFKEMRSKITEYFEREDVQKIINSANEKYLYWSEFKHRSVPKNTKHEIIWEIMRWSRNSNINNIRISKKNGFDFKYKILDRVQQKLHDFDMNLGGNMKGSLVPEADKDKFLINSIMEEAIASSQLEGAATTRKVAKDMLRKERKPRNKSEKMIVNNYATINRIKECLNKELTPKFLLDIHSRIVKDTLNSAKYEGKFRKSNDVDVVDKTTGAVYYTPPDYKILPRLIDDYCHFANTEQKIFIHPIIKATILHFLIGYIHPFVDGNGRTARAIFYWYLMSKGYWSFEYMSISRIIIKSPSQYARAYLFTEKDENDLTYFINYQVKTMDKAFNELIVYIKKKIAEKESLHELLKIRGINDRQRLIIKIFRDNPRKMLTINEIENTFGTVYQTARTDLLELTRLGVLEKRISGKKKYVFIRSNEYEKRISKLMN